MSKRFNVDWDAIGLGERNDCEIAAEVGCTRYAVLQQRRKRGIASCDHRRALRKIDAVVAACDSTRKIMLSDCEAAIAADKVQRDADVDESSNRA
jgi:hypothetical protein